MKLVARIKKLLGFTASELQQNNRSKLNLDLRNDNGINEEYWDDKLLKKILKVRWEAAWQFYVLVFQIV